MSAEILIRLPDYFPSLIEAMQDGFVLRDVDGTILEVNHAFCKIVGLKRADVIGTRPPHRWWPTDSHEQLDGKARGYFAGNASEDDLIFERGEGERFPVVVTNAPLRDLDDQIVGYIGTVKDMSERVAAADYIGFQAALIDQVSAGVVATDASGRVLFWNRGAEDLLGWRQHEVIGKPGQELMLGSDSGSRVAEIVAAFQNNEPWEGETPVVHKNGTPIPAYVSASVVRDSQQRPTGIVGVIVDISERKRAEARIAAQFQVAHVLSEARTTRAGLAGALEGVCTNLDWQYAGFWIVDEHLDMARCIATWHASDLDGGAFEDVSTSTPIERGDGLIGIGWESEQPIWIRDYQLENESPRQDGLLALGIGAAVALPIRIDGQIIGIVEFLATEAREQDDGLIVTLESIGSQIGQFIKRKRTERALRESEDRFRTMANSAPVLLWISDPDGRISWFNNGWLEYTGRSMERELGHGWIDGIHPDDRDDCIVAIAGAVATRQPFDLEFRLRRGDDAYHWIVHRGVPRFDTDGSFVGFIGSSLDISERKRHEQDQTFLSEATGLLASSLDYRETLTSVAQLAVPTIADWCVVHVVGTGGVIERLAVTHTDPRRLARAMELLQRIPPTSRAHLGIEHVIQTGEPLLIEQITDELLAGLTLDDDHRRLLDEVGPTSAIFQPIVAREQVLGAIAMISSGQGRQYGANDLALIQHLARRAAVAIDNAMLFLEAQGAALARDQFLAVAAHELRSPLTSMKGFAQLLLRRAKRMPGGSEWITPLQTIDTQVNRVTTLVSRLLDVSRIEEKRLQLQFDEVDMVEVVRGAAVEAQLATEDHTVAARFAAEELIISIDRTRVEQVLANLLDNAMKYSPEGTTIEIMLQVDDSDVIVSVSDEGPGISDEAQNRMFERYFRGTSSNRSASEGLGLGLYVSHGIVTAHGGRMWVESTTEPPSGTTFWLSLPRASRTVEPSADTDGGVVGA